MFGSKYISTDVSLLELTDFNRYMLERHPRRMFYLLVRTSRSQESKGVVWLSVRHRSKKNHEGYWHDPFNYFTIVATRKLTLCSSMHFEYTIYQFSSLIYHKSSVDINEFSYPWFELIIESIVGPYSLCYRHYWCFLLNWK